MRVHPFWISFLLILTSISFGQHGPNKTNEGIPQGNTEQKPDCAWSQKEDELLQKAAKNPRIKDLKESYGRAKGLLHGKDKDKWDLWGILRVGADLLESSDNSAFLGVLDQGFDLEHPSLKPRIKCQDLPWQDERFTLHGSHVAGTVGGKGPFSVAGKCNIQFGVCSYRNKEAANSEVGKLLGGLVDGNDYQKQLIEEIAWLESQGDIRAINASLKFGQNAGWIEAIEAKLKDGKIIFVNAAGNESSDLNQSFARLTKPKNILFVSSLSRYGVLSNFSNYGSAVYLSAPGEDIFSIDPRSPDRIKLEEKGETKTPQRASLEVPECGKVNLVSLSGTSMASPHVTGAIGAIASHAPKIVEQGELVDITTSHIRDILKETAIDIGPTGFDPFYGFGMVNVFGAVRLAQLRTKMSLPEAKQELIVESQKHLRNGLAAFEKALDSEEKSDIIQAGDTIRKAYFLNPKSLETKRALLLFNRVFGSSHDVIALGLELFANGCGDTFLLGNGEGEKLSQAKATLEAQIASEKDGDPLKRAIARLKAQRNSTEQDALVSQIDTPARFIQVLEELYKHKGSREDKQLLYPVLQRKIESLAKSPQEKSKYLPVIKEAVSKLVSTPLGDYESEILRKIESIYGNESGITFEDVKKLLERGEGYYWAKVRWPNELKEWELGKQKQQLEAMAKKIVAGELPDPKLSREMAVLVDGDKVRAEMVRKPIEDLWKSLSDEQKQKVLSDREHMGLRVLLLNAGIKEASDWVTEILKNGNAADVEQVAHWSDNFVPNEQIDGLVIPAIDRLVTDLAKADSKTKKEMGYGVSEALSRFTALVHKGRLSEDEFIDAIIRSIPAIVEADELVNGSRKGAKLSWDKSTLFESRPGREIPGIFFGPAPGISGISPSPKNLKKLLEERRKYLAADSDSSNAKLIDSILHYLFANKYGGGFILVQGEPLRHDTVADNLPYIFEKAAQRERRDKNYLSALIYHGIESEAVKEAIFSQLEASAKPITVWPDRKKEKELELIRKGGGLLMFTEEDSRVVRSPISAALVIDPEKGEELLQKKAKAQRLGEEDKMAMRLRAYSVVEDLNGLVSRARKRGDLEGSLSKFDGDATISKLRKSMMGSYNKLQEKNSKDSVLAALTYYHPSEEEKPFLNSETIKLFAEETTDDGLTKLYGRIKGTRTEKTIEELEKLDTKGWAENKVFQLKGLIRELRSEK